MESRLNLSENNLVLMRSAAAWQARAIGVEADEVLGEVSRRLASRFAEFPQLQAILDDPASGPAYIKKAAMNAARDLRRKEIRERRLLEVTRELHRAREALDAGDEGVDGDDLLEALGRVLRRHRDGEGDREGEYIDFVLRASRADASPTKLAHAEGLHERAARRYFHRGKKALRDAIEEELRGIGGADGGNP